MSLAEAKEKQRSLLKLAFYNSFPRLEHRFSEDKSGVVGGFIKSYNNDKLVFSSSIGQFNIHRIETNHGNIRHVNKAFGINIFKSSNCQSFQKIIDHFNNDDVIGDVFGNIKALDFSMMYKYVNDNGRYRIESYSSLQNLTTKIGHSYMQSNFRNTFKIKNDGKIVPVPSLVFIESHNRNTFLVSLNPDDNELYLVKNDSLSFEETFEGNNILDLKDDASRFVDILIDDFIKDFMKPNDPVREELILLPRNALMEKIIILSMYLV